jgi:hypothetical protein
MYDLNDLEKKWISYKRQKYGKILSLGGAFLGVAAVSFFAAYLLFVQKPKTEEPKKQLEVELNATKQPQVQTGVDASGLAPVCEKASDIQRELVIVSPTQNAQEFKSFAPTNEQSSPEHQQQATTTPPPKPKAPPKIQMETKTASHTFLLEERFRRNGDFETALTLSEEYYKNSDYQKALKWAVSANSIDSKNEKSWILFAKSSYKLGRKQDAINALDNFAKTGGSDQIRALLRQLKADEL